ncbi:MAG: GIY-YIG nuclease family protein [Candidatus Omnitrophota bacterium]
MWYVYIIQNDTNKRFYIGSTNNITRRLAEHNRSKKCSVTHFGKYFLIHQEEFSNIKEARVREQQIKSYKGGNAFKKLLRERAGLNIINTAPSSSLV